MIHVALSFFQMLSLGEVGLDLSNVSFRDPSVGVNNSKQYFFCSNIVRLEKLLLETPSTPINIASFSPLLIFPQLMKSIAHKEESAFVLLN